ncbi:pyridoxal-phosphate dependent enzyme [Metapseudomonas otitidis]|uniref:pyridoxal-phosphate dependent enzyme n=1 Tax=Metapseudomonas otitidis TaxID=319939 RepID=UPI0039FDD60C
MALHIETPLIHSHPLSAAAGRRVRLKLEALQPPGSFKIRGVGAACEVHARAGKRRFICSSGGNAGLAMAFAGRQLGVPVTVVVPENTPERAREALRREGADLRVHGAAWHEANELALSLVGPEDAFIHPFDDPLLWSGHASLVDEAVRQGPRPGAVVLSVGGGGLFSGVVEGLRRNGWDDVPVVTVETQGAASFAAAREAGMAVTLDTLATCAGSLAARRVCDRAVELARLHPVRSHRVSDREALQACERFLDDHRLLVEPACGAALAALYGECPALEDLDDVLVVACGGVTASLEQIRVWREQAAG